MILAIDSATRWLAVGLHDGTAVIAEVGYRCLNNHTQELAPTVRHLMKQVDVTPNALSGIAVTIGPGSYTGLRVGLALAKGMALVHDVPLLAVPTLDVVAMQLPQFEGKLMVVAEAGRTRICVAPYQWQRDAGWVATEPPDIKTWQDVLEQQEGKTLFAGEIFEKTAVKIQAQNSDFRVAKGGTAVRRAGNLAELGWQKLQAGEMADPATITPLYLRDPAGA